ncbi:MAG: universal stress protein E [Pseudoalteromonas tetraodonis]|jgi:universal stress protein E
MRKLKNILVGVDYSQPSIGALREAARCAAWDNACLTALHVIDDEPLVEMQDEVEIGEDSIIDHAQRRLGSHLEGILGEDPGVYFDAVIGNPIEQFLLAAERACADLIVLGSHGRLSRRSSRIGVLAERCLRKARQNVLLVRDAEGSPFRRVVACIDFSPTSRKAAKQAIHVAQQDGSSLEFIHVFRPAAEILTAPSIEAGILFPPVENFDDLRGAALESKLEHFVAPLLDEFGSVEHTISIIADPSPRAGIVDRLNESKADLVVLGTRGRTTLKSLLMGSTAQKVLHTTNCSALVVKPDGFEYTLD